MADLTQLNNAARHREHDKKLRDLDRRVKAAEKAVNDLKAAGAQPAIIENAEARLKSLEATQLVFSQQLLAAEKRLDGHDERLDSHDLRLSNHGQRIESVEVRTSAHAMAIAALQDANGWIPVAAAAVAGVITYVVIELFRDSTATHIQWAWTVGIAAIVGIITSLLTGNRQLMTSSASAGASAGVSSRSGGNGGGSKPPAAPAPTTIVPVPPADPSPSAAKLRALPDETPSATSSRVIAQARAEAN